MLQTRSCAPAGSPRASPPAPTREAPHHRRRPSVRRSSSSRKGRGRAGRRALKAETFSASPNVRFEEEKKFGCLFRTSTRCDHSTSPFAEDSSGSVTNGCRAGREAGPHACMRPSTICTMPPIHCLQMYRRLAPARSQQRGPWRKRRAKRVLGCSSLPTVARSR